MEVSAAAEERAQAARAAHQAKLVRAEQQAALVQQKKLQQTVELQKRGKLVTMRNQAIHNKRCACTSHLRLMYKCIVQSISAVVASCSLPIDYLSVQRNAAACVHL